MTPSHDAIRKLKQNLAIFRNAARINSDQGVEHEHENIEHIIKTREIPKGNGQIERLRTTIIAVF